MNVNFSTGAGLIIIGTLLLLSIVPGVTELLGALWGRQIPSVWRNSTKFAFAISGIILIAIGLVITFKIEAQPSLTPTPTFTPIPTVSTPSTIATSVPAPTETLSPSPVPTETLLPSPTITETLSPSPTPTPAIGQDFEVNCIDSKYWVPYKGEKLPKDNRGCWDLSSMGISAQDGGLLIAADKVNGYTRSIYTHISESAEIQLTIRIDKLSTVKEVDSSLVFGIGSPEKWLSNGKFLIYRVISPDSQVYVFWADSVLGYGDTFFPNYIYGQEQKIVFSINGLLLDVYVNGLKVRESIALSPTDKKIFWIGSWVANNGDVRVFIKDFRIIKK